jgi:hypothetical protein
MSINNEIPPVIASLSAILNAISDSQDKTEISHNKMETLLKPVNKIITILDNQDKQFSLPINISNWQMRVE